jgi:hypothetical protein
MEFHRTDCREVRTEPKAASTTAFSLAMVWCKQISPPYQGKTLMPHRPYENHSRTVYTSVPRMPRRLGVLKFRSRGFHGVGSLTTLVTQRVNPSQKIGVGLSFCCR